MTTKPASHAAPSAGRTLILGAIVSMSAAAVDLCLPAITTIAADTGADNRTAQLIVSGYLAGFAIGQPFWGPVSDRYGRLPALYAGLSVFVLLSLYIATRSGMSALIALRAAQGFAGAVGPVVGRAMVRDLGGGTGAATLMASLTAWIGTAPLLAPLLGGGLLVATGWRGIFVFMALFALLVLAATRFRLGETHANPDPAALSAARLSRNFMQFFSLPQCRFGLGLVAIPFAGYLSLIAGSGPLLVEVYGVPPGLFGFVFGIAAGGFVIATLWSRRVVARRSMPVMLRWGTGAVGCAGLLLLASSVPASPPLAVVWSGATLYMFGMGLLLPNATVTALEPVPEMAGFAVAIIGCVQISTGAVVSAIAAYFYAADHRALTVAMGLAGVLTVLHYRRGRPAA